MGDYVKEQVEAGKKETLIESCTNVIKVGVSLDDVLEAFKGLDANRIHDLFAQFALKKV